MSSPTSAGDVSPGLATLRAPAHRVSANARWKWLIGEQIFTFVIAVVGGVVAYFWDWLGDRWWIIAALAGLQFCYGLVAPFVRHRVYRWEVSDTAVYTQDGVLSLERTIVPISRIQTVEVSTGLFDRLLNLSSIDITTAATLGTVEISGLDRGTAERLADELTVKADIEGGDGT